jgi:hypothetical protein
MAQKLKEMKESNKRKQLGPLKGKPPKTATGMSVSTWDTSQAGGAHTPFSDLSQIGTGRN